MPRIPDREIFGERPRMAVDRSTPTSQYSDAPAQAAVQGLSQIGQAAGRVGQAIEGKAVVLQQMGQGLQEYGIKKQELMDDEDLVAAKTQWLRDSLDIDASFDNDQNYSGYKDKYNKSIMESRNRVLGMVRNPELRNKFASSLEMDILRGQRQIQQKTQAGYKDARMAHYAKIQDDNEKAMYETPDLAKREALQAINLSAIDIQYRAGDIDQSQRQALTSKAKESYARIAGSLIKDPKERMNFFAAKDEKTLADDISPLTRAAGYEAAENEYKRNVAMAASKVEAEIKNLQNGFVSTPDVEVEVYNTANAYSNEPDVAGAMQRYEFFKNTAERFRYMSPEQIRNERNNVIYPAAREEGATQIEREAVGFYTDYLKTYEENLYTDSVNTAVERGIILNAPPVDIDDGESMRNRQELWKYIGAKTGIGSDATFFTKQESEKYSKVLSDPEVPVENKLIMLKTIRSTLDGNAAVVAMHDVTKDTDLTMEYAGGMMAAGLDGTAKNILIGSQMMKQSDSFKPSKDVSDQIVPTFGGAINMQPHTQQSAMVEATKAIYVAIGGDPKIIDTIKMKEAARLAAGGDKNNEKTGIADVNGVPTLLPPLVPSNVFEHAISKMDDADLEALTGGIAMIWADDERVTAERIKEIGYFKSVGDGRYQIMSLDDPGNPIVDGVGNAVVIKLGKKQLEGLLAKPNVTGRNNMGEQRGFIDTLLGKEKLLGDK